MVEHFKADVHAWDMVNEPMKEDGTLRGGNVANPASDEFYWVKYLGKDYAVKAFKLPANTAMPTICCSSTIITWNTALPNAKG